MKKTHNHTLLLALCLGAASCTPHQVQEPLRPAALNPAPIKPVTATALPNVDATVPSAPGSYTPPNVTTASAGGDLQAIPQLPTSSSSNITALSDNIKVGPDIDFGRNDVLGTWNVSAQADTCALNLSLTTWTAGFRASTRKCSNSTLTTIGSWTLAGKQLTLSNAQGTTLARLVASGPNRFDGTTTNGGKAISVFR